MFKTTFISLFLFLNLNLIAQQYKLVWSDEFNGTELDRNNWNYEYGNGINGWGTGQDDFCTDRDKNVKVSNGWLKLTLQYEAYKGFSYTSGKINTKDKVAFKYGKIEARIRIPAGRGIGAAFWMLPNQSELGNWPKSGEIDILETNGDELEKNYGTVHFEQWGTHQHNGNNVHIPGNISKEFHTYWVEWNEESIKWFVDGKKYHEFNIKEAIDNRKVFHDPFYIILSTGVGSQFSGDIIDSDLLPQSMEVDYVRVYQLATVPQILHATTNGKGSEIEVKFSESMMQPLPSDASFFSVSTNKGRSIKCISVVTQYRDNTVFVFKLDSLVRKDERIYLNYQGEKILGGNKEKLPPVKNFPIANILTGAPPVLYEAKTDGYNQIYLRFTKYLSVKDSVPAKLFSVKVNGKENNIVKVLPIDDKLALKISVASALFKEDKIQVSYLGELISSYDGVKLESFESIQVENHLKDLLAIPGKIEAEEYSLADGIRTQSTNDEGGGGNIGYIDDGDFLEYVLKVPESGQYNLRLRVASEPGNAVIDVLVNEMFSGMVKVSSTGGWQEWKTIEGLKLKAESGIIRLRLVAKKGGFNLNWIELQKE